MKKKICVFCSLPSFNTGMPISTYKLVVGLMENGQVDVCVVLPGEGELGERLRAAGVSVAIIPFKRMRGNPMLMLRFLGSWIRAGWRFFKFVRKNNVDIVHFSDVIDAPFYPWVRMAGARTVAHVRVCVGGVAVRRFFKLWTRFFCSRVITVSKFAKDYFRFNDKRASVIYNPGPDRTIFNVGATCGRPPTPDEPKIPIITAIASFRRDKGHHNFLKIAAKIKERLSGQVKFVIVGGKIPGHEDYYNEMMALAQRLGLDDEYLTVTGNLPHEQIPPIMATANILLHVPDWEEALGGVILEAMAMGVAVVAYKCGGVGECFTDGVSGFLVKRGGVDEAVNKVINLLDDPVLMEKITASARAELDEKFTLDKYVGNVERIYDEL